MPLETAGKIQTSLRTFPSQGGDHLLRLFPPLAGEFERLLGQEIGDFLLGRLVGAAECPTDQVGQKLALERQSALGDFQQEVVNAVLITGNFDSVFGR